jgi:hypothetical protein
MKAADVVRSPELVLLCTTGLFGRSSQYNRISVPSEELGSDGFALKFIELKTRTSYGTFHFSLATMKEMERLNRANPRGSVVNSVFGEGVNPKMRKLREALDRLGFPSDSLLQHASPRSVYVVPLASNFREVLIGKSRRANYYLSPGIREDGTRMLVKYWMKRWLINRLQDPANLDSVARHTLCATHGAVVELPEIEPTLETCFERSAEDENWVFA